MGSNVENTGIVTRDMVLLTAAYGVFLMCTSVLLWGDYLQVLPAASAGSFPAAVGYFAGGISFPATFLVIAVVAYLKPGLVAWRSLYVALALAIAGGMLLLVQVYLSANSIIASVMMGCLMGASSAMYFGTLQELVAGQKIFQCGLVVFAAAAVSSILYLVLSLFPESTVIWIALFVCLPVTVLLCARVAKTSSHGLHPMFQTIPRNNKVKLKCAASDLWKPLICISFSAFLIGMIRADTIADSGILNGVNDSSMIGLIVAAAVLLAAWKRIYERTLLSKLQMIIFPLIATSFLLLPFLGIAGRGFFVSFASTVFSITSSLMVVSCARTARMYAVHPILVYAAFACVVYSFLECGTILSYSLGGLNSAGTLWLFAIALIVIYVLSMALTVGRKTPGKRVSALSSESSAEAGPIAIIAPAAMAENGADVSERVFSSIASRYGLTAREREVMVLMAQGRDVPFIADELVISKNTVRTHVKNIFAKMGVHSKQELIDLVQVFEA